MTLPVLRHQSHGGFKMMQKMIRMTEKWISLTRIMTQNMYYQMQRPYSRPIKPRLQETSIRQSFLFAAYKDGLLIKEPKGPAFVTVIRNQQVSDS
jgi:hypothetical protein